MLKSARCVLALFVGVLGFVADSSAIERTAYAVDGYSNLVSGILPTPVSMMQLTTVADYDSDLLGSAMDSDGSLLTMFVDTDELVRIDLATFDYEILHTLAVDVWWYDDLVLGPAGELLLVVHGTYSGTSSLYDISIQTGELTLLADFEHEFTTIEYHQGSYYASAGSTFWRIDPVTYEIHLITDYFAWWSSCHIWGLDSVGETLWCGFSCGTSATHLSQIGIVDPATGDFTETHAVLEGIQGAHADPFILQIIERTTPIPALGPTGIVILVMALGLVGILAIRRL